MLPYLIAGAIGYVVAKLFEDETPKFADGGSVGNIIVTNEYEEFDSEVFNELEDEILYGFVVKDENKRIGLISVEDDVIELGIGYILGLEVFEKNKGYGKKIMKKIFEIHTTQHAFGGKATSTSKGFWLNLGAEFDEFDEYSFILSKNKLKYADGGLIAPNGKRSYLTPEQYKLVRTNEFKAWFGDWQNDPANASKVVDENGEPLVVLHGTNSNYNIFKKSKNKSYANNVFGFFFTTEKWIADSYGEDISYYFLNLKNVITLNNTDFQIHLNYKTWDDNLKTLKEYKKDKIDGIYYKHNIYVAFEPEQIKLADGSNTTFDSNNPDIRFDGGGRVSNYKQFYDNLQIEDGSKYIGQKFADIFPIFRGKQTSPAQIRISVKEYNNLLGRLENDNYTTKGLKTADLNRLEKTQKYIDKNKYLSRFYLDPSGRIINFDNSDNAYASGGGIDSYYEELKPEVDYYSVNYDDMDGQKFRDNIFDTLTEAKALFNKLCVTGKTFERVDINTIELIAFYENGLYEVLDSKAFINTYPKFLNNLQIEDGSKYIGQKFTDVFPYLKRSDFTPYKFKIKVKRYNNILRRLSEDNYSTKSMKTADLNRLEKIEPTIEKVKYLSKFFCDNSKTILSFDNSDNAYAGGGKVQPKDLTKINNFNNIQKGVDYYSYSDNLEKQEKADRWFELFLINQKEKQLNKIEFNEFMQLSNELAWEDLD